MKCNLDDTYHYISICLFSAEDHGLPAPQLLAAKMAPPPPPPAARLKEGKTCNFQKYLYTVCQPVKNS